MRPLNYLKVLYFFQGRTISQLAAPAIEFDRKSSAVHYKKTTPTQSRFTYGPEGIDLKKISDYIEEDNIPPEDVNTFNSISSLSSGIGSIGSPYSSLVSGAWARSERHVGTSNVFTAESKVHSWLAEHQQAHTQTSHVGIIYTILYIIRKTEKLCTYVTCWPRYTEAKVIEHVQLLNIMWLVHMHNIHATMCMFI